MVRLAFLVQHHPARADLLGPLLDRLGPGAIVAADPEPDSTRRHAIRSYLAALEAVPAEATHAVIVQDDVEPVPSFPELAARAVLAEPNRLLAFFAPAQPPEMAHAIRCAAERGEFFCELPCRRWVPAVALAWPVDLVASFLAWKQTQRWPPAFGADDEGIGNWARAEGVRVLATVPSLVEHPDEVESLVGRRPRGGRRAALFGPPSDESFTISAQTGADVVAPG